jgi:chromosome segregation ATPase
MHIHFLEEQRLSAGSDNIDLVMKQNIELKMRFQQLDAEHSTLKKENKALHSSITRLSDTIQELEVDKEELRQRVTIRNASTNDIHDQLEDMEQQNYTLRENLVLAQQQLQDSVNEIERLRERRHSASISARMEDLEHTIERLKEAEADTNRRLTDADEELDKYHDALESEKRHTAQLEVQVERLQFEQKRASQERSHSRAEMLDDLEDREALESVRTTGTLYSRNGLAAV